MQYDEVKELIAIFEKTDLNDMEVQLDNARIRLNRGTVSPWAVAPVAAQPAAVSAQPVVSQPVNVSTDTLAAESKEESVSKAEETAEGSKVIKAPIVGTFYQSSAPDKEPFVKVGDTVAQGDVVCIIEAMKFMNEVNSEVSGTITEILVKDGEFVEYGQELFRVK
ncbi:MAG: acetyl-CoA carboxylase biotin carboxyl carrier protein [Butyribacter sp.]|nr:acetyl-CoA carboxylase biotin carboxyl carrier protein [bacterium]MDY3853607.1 acetyl-CoA carboxylase biotin carboxyl carrier protein [Butyribacter sp.]